MHPLPRVICLSERVRHCCQTRPSQEVSNVEQCDVLAALAMLAEMAVFLSELSDSRRPRP